MSVHLGMHIRQITTGLAPKKPVVTALHIFFLAIALVGVYEFISLNFVGYMFGQVQFVFIDTSKSAIFAALEYLSVMALFAEGGYWLNKALIRNNNHKSDQT